MPSGAASSPKGISPANLQGPEQPSLAELKAAFNLHRLSRALAEAFCQRDVPYPSDMVHLHVDMSQQTHRLAPEPPGRIKEWWLRVSQAVFRVLIVGAALAGTYWEPIPAAGAHHDPEIRALVARYENWGPKTFEFLLSFAAYDLEAPLEAQDALFARSPNGCLEISWRPAGRDAMAARFEKGVGRARLRPDGEPEGRPCPLTTVLDVSGSSHTPPDAHFVVWELMKMWWVIEQLRPWDPPEPAAVSREERWFSQPAVVSGPFPSPPVLSSSPTSSEPPPPLAVAVLFGVWRAENIVCLPAPASSVTGKRCMRTRR